MGCNKICSRKCTFAIVFFLIIFAISLAKNVEYSTCTPDVCSNGLCVNDTCVCDEGWRGDKCQLCKGRIRITDESGIIHDGGGNYSVDNKCTWLIQSPNGSPIQLIFHQFSTECGWDHLYVFDGTSIFSPLVASFSGISPFIEIVTLYSGTAYLYFFSDAAFAMDGFNITYKSLSCPNGCSNYGYCNATTQICECNAGWFGPACNESLICPSNCSGCESFINGTCFCHSGNAGKLCSQRQTDAFWESITTSWRPAGRASSAAAILGDFYYVFGGDIMFDRYQINASSAAFYRYNISQSSWEIIDNGSVSAPYNTRRESATLTADEQHEELHLFGGKVEGTITGDYWTYRPATQQWTQGPSGLNSSGHTAHIIMNKLYIFFGYSPVRGFNDGVEVLDLANPIAWTTLLTHGAVVKGRSVHTSVYSADVQKVFVYGGLQPMSPTAFSASKSLYSLSMIDYQWTVLPSGASSVYLHSSVMWRGFMLTFGGNSDNNSSGSTITPCFTATVTLYDTRCNEWHSIQVERSDVQNLSRHGHNSFTHEDSVYVYGGYNGFMLGDILKFYPGDCAYYQTELECEGANDTRQQWRSGSFCHWNSTANSCHQLSSTLNSNLQCKSSASLSNQCFHLHDCSTCLSSLASCEWSAHAQVKCRPCNSCEVKEFQCLDYQTINDRCSQSYNCYSCHSNKECQWVPSRKCSARSTLENNATVDICDPPCSHYDTCDGCTSSECLWCESQKQCVESNSYLVSFPYGQCLEWTTSTNKCSNVSCAGLQTCSACQMNPACGWCNGFENNGVGSCVLGGNEGSLGGQCNVSQWFFAECPACQCNGHSTCTLDECGECADNTTGLQCELCSDGFYGNPVNGGNCSVCKCGDLGSSCDRDTGNCHCKVQGASGPKCNKCDILKGYRLRASNQQCYYQLGVGYLYTFNFSKPEDMYTTVVNMISQPNRDDENVDMEITCYGYTLINLTLESSFYPDGKHVIISNRYCENHKISMVFDHGDYHLGKDKNASFYLTLHEFATPFIFKVSFSQYSRIDLFRFFLIFFACFISLLITALVVWKLKIRYGLLVRRRRQQHQMRTMASRPFSSVMLSLEQLKCSELTEVPSVLPEHKLTLTKNAGTKKSRRSAMKELTQEASPIGFEPTSSHKAGVISVIIKLPTGDADKPGHGQSGLALGSALINMGPSNSTYAIQRVTFSKNKVTMQATSPYNQV